MTSRSKGMPPPPPPKPKKKKSKNQTTNGGSFTSFSDADGQDAQLTSKTMKCLLVGGREGGRRG